MRFCRILASAFLFLLIGAFVSNLAASPELDLGESRFSVFQDKEKDFILIESSSKPDSGEVIFVNGEETPLRIQSKGYLLSITPGSSGQLLFLSSESNEQKSYQLLHAAKRNNGSIRLVSIPLWLSVLPPLIAILMALIFREVIISLFTGIWVGSFIAGGMRLESPYYLFISFLKTIEQYVVAALTDGGHISIIIFSLLIGGMVGIISKNGGMAGIVNRLSRYAKSPQSAQFVTWLLGVAIFFDDYANTLIVGNTMRPVTDRFRISREKLAYIVDSTAAPVAAVAFITTWIGAELGFIESGVSQIVDFDQNLSAYGIFFSSLKYSFYPILTLIFILMLIYTQRDYGPMRKAELRARKTGKVSSSNSSDEDDSNIEDLSPVKGAPKNWLHGFLPVLTVIIVTLLGLIATGMESTYSELREAGANPGNASWGSIWSAMPALWPEGEAVFFLKMGKLIGNADSYVALLWASFSGAALAIIITLYNRIMTLWETMNNFLIGFKTILPAILILTLAWSLAITTDELHTVDFLSVALEGNLNPYLMPVIVFILAALISFSTGSSWSTMTILYPIAIPTTWLICQSAGLGEDISMEILLNVISVVLAASVLGDHCSPISDTTILSSLASDCNHIDHVRTQLPYALTVGAVSIVLAGLSTLLGGGWLICTILLLISIVILYGVVLRYGQTVGNGEG